MSEALTAAHTATLGPKAEIGDRGRGHLGQVLLAWRGAADLDADAVAVRSRPVIDPARCCLGCRRALGEQRDRRGPERHIDLSGGRLGQGHRPPVGSRTRVRQPDGEQVEPDQPAT